jgi:hypothetical protein
MATLFATMIGAPGYADAAVTVYTTHPGGYNTAPSSQSGKAGPRDLGASITVPAGDTFYLSSKVVVDSAEEVTEVSAMILCAAPGVDPTGNNIANATARAVSGQNVLTGSSATTVLTRGLFTAPPDSALVCGLYAALVNHVADTAGHIYVGANTYLQNVRGNLSWYQQKWQPTRVLDDTSVNAATSALFTAPADAASFDVIGDVNVTTCPSYYTKAPCDVAARTTYPDAYVGTQLVVQQFNADGSTCGAAWNNGPLAGTSVPNQVHHYKINTWGTVPVSSSCTARHFRIWIRVTANVAHNSFVIEDNNETVTAAFI